MANVYVERTIQSVVTLVAVISLTFGMIRLLPGGPMQYLKAQLMQQSTGMSMQRINNLVQAYTNVNPSEPIYVQYYNYVTSVLTGDLGQSVWYGKPVSQILFDALPWTIFLMSVSLVLIFSIGVLIGAVMAYAEGSRFDVASTLVSIFLTAIPYYVAAVLLVYVLGYQLGWFPTGGRYQGVEPGFTLAFFVNVLYHGALPILSLVLTGFGLQAVSMRGNAIRILGEDYLRVARLRGVPDRLIATRYVGRNAILPMYTGFMISIGFLFGGSVILEQIFAYPGVGYYLFQAISSRDYPLMMGAFLIITFMVVVAVYIADLTYGLIDPRVRGGDREAY